MKLAQWRLNNPIDGMNNCGIMMVNNTLMMIWDLWRKGIWGILHSWQLEILEEIPCEFEYCVFYIFEVYGPLFMYEYLDQNIGLNNKEARQ